MWLHCLTVQRRPVPIYVLVRCPSQPYHLHNLPYLIPSFCLRKRSTFPEVVPTIDLVADWHSTPDIRTQLIGPALLMPGDTVVLVAPAEHAHLHGIDTCGGSRIWHTCLDILPIDAGVLAYDRFKKPCFSVRGQPVRDIGVVEHRIEIFVKYDPAPMTHWRCDGAACEPVSRRVKLAKNGWVHHTGTTAAPSSLAW